MYDIHKRIYVRINNNGIAEKDFYKFEPEKLKENKNGKCQKYYNNGILKLDGEYLNWKKKRKI